MIKGSKMNLEQRKRLSESHKGQIGWMKGKHQSIETKKKISEANMGKYHWTGKHHTPETKEKLKLRPQHFQKGHLPWNTNKHLSDELRSKLSKIRKENISSGKIKVWNKLIIHYCYGHGGNRTPDFRLLQISGAENYTI